MGDGGEVICMGEDGRERKSGYRMRETDIVSYQDRPACRVRVGELCYEPRDGHWMEQIRVRTPEVI